jgi:Protein of unknown function (DUF1236)
MLRYSIVALALAASSTFALADPNSGGAKGPASSGGAMEHSQGATPGGPMGGAMKEGHSGSGNALRGSEMKGDRSSDASEDRSRSMRKNSASEEKRGKADRQQASDEKGNFKDRNRQAEDNDRASKRDQRAQSSDHKKRTNSDQAADQSRRDKGATGASEGTEGKSAPKGSVANISPEQKMRMKSAFGSHHVAPARNIGVAVNVGVVVPRSVHFYPIPEDIVTIVPDYSGYEYFMIDDAHVAIVDPDTLEVVDIIVIA